MTHWKSEICLWRLCNIDFEPTDILEFFGVSCVTSSTLQNTEKKISFCHKIHLFNPSSPPPLT